MSEFSLEDEVRDVMSDLASSSATDAQESSPAEETASEQVSQGEQTPETPEAAPDEQEKAEEELNQESDKQAQPQKAASEAPVSWSDEMKQKFAQLPPDVQQYMLKRESERDAFVEQKSQEANRFKQQYESVDSAFNSVRHVLQQNNMTTPQAVTELVGLFKYAQQDPIGYANYFLQSKGINLQQLASGQFDQASYQQQQLSQKIAQLESELGSVVQGKTAEQDQIYMNDIQKFSAAPENKYFDQVSEEMALLLETGRASDLKTAYETACLMKPEVRALVEKEKAEARAKEIDAKAKAAKKAAGVSLNSKGYSTVKSKAPESDNMEDTVRDVYRNLMSGNAA